jgi:hypothetical protein
MPLCRKYVRQGLCGRNCRASFDLSSGGDAEGALDESHLTDDVALR